MSDVAQTVETPKIDLRTFSFQDSDAAHIEKLTPEHQDIVAAFQRVGNYSQIAAELEIPIGTVKSRLNRARHRIIVLRQRGAAQQAA